MCVRCGCSIWVELCEGYVGEDDIGVQQFVGVELFVVLCLGGQVGDQGYQVDQWGGVCYVVLFVGLVLGQLVDEIVVGYLLDCFCLYLCGQGV